MSQRSKKTPGGYKADAPLSDGIPNFQRTFTSGQLPKPARISFLGKGKAIKGHAPSAVYLNWFFGLLLLVVTVLVYQPAWNGKPIWDDDLHLITPELRSLTGLAHIWIQPERTQQYHPLVDTLFWVEDKLWGNSMLGYHLVNILLHAISALLLLKILRHLGVPGAWLAAAIFALHPVHVESVAWLVELKNTLSGVFFFGSALAYLKFDESRSRTSYALVLLLFALGLVAKTIVAMLPVSMLIVLWWKRGRLKWKQDVKPLIPLFIVGIPAGLFTAWMERKFSGAEGEAFDLSIVERFLTAGRAFWFYLGKLFWPADLVMIYPRWNVSPTVWWQYLFPITALLLFAALWACRRRWPPVLAGLLFFGVMLFPLLGFFNVYYFKFSLVADHFQYLPSVGIITLVSTGAAVLIDRLQSWHRTVGYGFCLVVLATLAALTWRQSRIFRDPETCYRAIIAKNPDCSQAHNNLGGVLLQKRLADEAIVQYEKALEINPDYQLAHYNLGVAFLQKGQLNDAIAELQEVLIKDSGNSKARYNLANTFLAKGLVEEAIASYETVLQIQPNYVDARIGLGNALLEQGQVDDAIAHYQKALEVQPVSATAYYNLAVAVLRKGQVDEAIAFSQKALDIQSDYPDAHYFLGNSLFAKGRVNEAITHWQKSFELQPENWSAADALAWVFATYPSASVRDGARAIDLAQQALKLSSSQKPIVFRTLAAAYAETGRFPEAIDLAQQGLELATAQGDLALINKLETDISFYQKNTPLRDTTQ